MQIEKSDYDSWLQHPVTREVRKVLLERMDKLAHTVLKDGWQSSTPFIAENSGAYNELLNLLTMQYEDIATGEFTPSGYLTKLIREHK